MNTGSALVAKLVREVLGDNEVVIDIELDRDVVFSATGWKYIDIVRDMAARLDKWKVRIWA